MSDQKLDKCAEVPHPDVNQDALDLLHPLHRPLVKQDQVLRVIRNERIVLGAPGELDARGEVMSTHHRCDDSALLHTKLEKYESRLTKG